MNIESERIRINQLIDRAKRDGLQHFLGEPATKLILSVIPPGPIPDALKTLIASAYEHGFDHGCMTLGLDVATSIAKRQGL